MTYPVTEILFAGMSNKEEIKLIIFSLTLMLSPELQTTATPLTLGVISLIFCVIKAFLVGDPYKIVGAFIFGFSMIALYTMSSVYHGLKSGMAKKVMQVIDHCMIYTLIAGTYTPIVLGAMVPVFPGIGWGLLAWQWGLAALAVTLTAIDLHRYKVFSMICYIGMGWSIIFLLPQALQVLGPWGFGYLLAGGIAYTVGAILFGIGSKVKWMHSVFHIFVILGSVLQAIAVMFFVL